MHSVEHYNMLRNLTVITIV